MTKNLQRGGFTLFEMLVVMSTLALLLGLIAATLLGTMRIERADAAFFHRILEQSALADQFRGDVARALEAPAQWGDYEAGPDCLILRHAGDRHVVYRWADKRLLRTTFAGQTKTEQLLPTGAEPELVTVEFSQAGPRQWLLHLSGAPGPGTPRPRFDVHVVAALGGELR